MYIEQQQFEDRIYKASVVLEKWNNDIEYYSKLLDAKRAKNEPTAQIEITLNNNRLRLSEFLNVISAANTLILAMSEQIDSLKKQNRYLETETERPQREAKRICDMPRSAEALHAEQLDLLYNIIDLLNKN